MPRRPLLVLTALVLALHWLVLQGMPMAWDGNPSAAPAAQVFSTRSIAPPPPPRPVAAPTAPPAPARPAAARKKPAAPPATQHPVQAAKATDTPALPDAPAPPETSGEPGDASTVAPAVDAPPISEAPDAVVAAAPQPPASAAAPAASTPEIPAPASGPDNNTGAGVDISPPGGEPGRPSSTAAPAVRLPAPVRLAFDVSGQAKKFNYNARAELLWQHDGSRYEARQEISAFLVGSRSQRSVGHVTPQGLQPERFADRSRSEQAAHFDHGQGRVTFSANTPQAAAGPGAQDRLSVFIQLGAMLAADPGRFVPGTQVTLTTVSARSADRWTFSIEGQETLDLPTGPLLAWKLQRLPRRDYDQKAELWLAPDLGYMPVRIRLTQANGDFADLRLRSSGPP
ncbi:hypothetical protein CBP34_01845 [Acidovorax carolinensis]|uniref:DUF3108 domain-containing protein n=1 Tax=Acidovorax carolinensis TaxID=553814 RepID=A0A240TZS3_9BURK|nr:DUF3108 domain-containing protein [Acidovorax carolinensis]ART50653.1 hypothetical protein CBP34_01845 [Acidovorax carolinensis]